MYSLFRERFNSILLYEPLKTMTAIENYAFKFTYNYLLEKINYIF